MESTTPKTFRCDICFTTTKTTTKHKLRCHCKIKVCKSCVTKWIQHGKNECPQCRKPLMKNQQAKYLKQQHRNKELTQSKTVDPPDYLPLQFFTPTGSNVTFTNTASP